MATLRENKFTTEFNDNVLHVIKSLFEKYRDAFHIEIGTNISLENCHSILNTLLYSNKVKSAKDKLEIIDALDEIKIIEEKIKIESGEILKSEIESASKNLGKKSQSAIKNK